MECFSPRVSVIIPVYNAAHYIERCCRSLFEQTLNEIEYIFVNDCSTDNSVHIINEIASQYPEREGQIRVLSHSPNLGVSFSRQQGMDAANGEFIIHCDSDDWVEPEMYELMYRVAIEEQADIVCCGYYVEYSSGERVSSTYPERKTLGDVIFNIGPRIGSVWNKLVRLSMLRDAGVNFPQSINWGEDFCVSVPGLVLSRKTILLPDLLYHYRQNSDSITHTLSLNRCKELIECATFVESFLQRVNIIDQYVHQLNYLKFQLKQYLLIFPEVRNFELWTTIYPECHAEIMSYDVPLYLRFASKCIVTNHISLAKIILACRDLVVKVRSR